MCLVCYGIGNCPCCGHGSDEEDQYYDELDNWKSDEADDWNDEQKLNQQTDEQ